MEEEINVDNDESLESQEVPEQGGAEEQTADTNFDWTTDKRFKDMWSEDPNNLYKSYRNLEKTYTPLTSKLEGYDKIFKQYDIKADKLSEVFEELKELKNPESSNNQWLQVVNWLNGNPEVKTKFNEFLQNTYKQEQRRRWGDNLPDEVLDKLEKTDVLENELNIFKQAQEQQKLQQEMMSIIEDKISVIDKLAEEYNIDWNDDTKNSFLAHCQKNEIDPKYMDAEFSRLALQATKEASQKKTEEAMLNNIKKSKTGSIMTTKPKMPNVSNKDPFESMMDKIMSGEIIG